MLCDYCYWIGCSLLLFSALLVSFALRILRIKSLDAIRRIFNSFREKKPFLSSLFQVDIDSPRHGGELVAEVLKGHGVCEVFTLCGGHISPILVACEALGIRVLDARHEANAVFAADAVARLRQDIGVAAVTAGPGITNVVTALKNAQMAESSVLLLGGAAPSLLKGRGALQDIDQQILLKPICKFTARVNSVQEIVPTIRKAIATAKSGTPGPVFVELPIDVLYPYKVVEKEVARSSGKNPKGLKIVVDFFLRAYVSRVFSAAWLPQEIGPLPVRVPNAREEDIERLAALLKQAKRPLMLVGSQAMSAPVKAKDLAKTVETLGLPVYLGGMSRGLLGANCPLQMRQERKEALKETDLVILAGAVCDFRLSYGRSISPRSKVVIINRSAEQMLKNHGVFWHSSLAIQADVASTLVRLKRNLDSSGWDGAPQQWLNELRERNQSKEMRNAYKAAETTTDGQLNPLKLLTVLNSVLPEDTILVADGGDFVGSAAYIVQPRGPLQWLDPGAFGTLGVGAGFALGAKAIHPERPVLIIYGDGACGFSLIEFDSFVRHRLPIVALIGNDACWSQIARDQVPWFQSAVGCELAYTSYEKTAAGLGAEGILIQSPVGEDELRKRLQNALIQSKELQGKSVVLNAIIGKTDFREGSISV